MALKPVKVTMADHEPVVATLVTAGVGLAVMIEDEALVYREAGQAAVWDEIVGYLVTMIAVPLSWQWILSGFVLFRLFDIWKPWPIS